MASRACRRTRRPGICALLNYNDLRDFMERVPFMDRQTRSDVSAIGEED